jgi:hypothetical protein
VTATTLTSKTGVMTEEPMLRAIQCGCVVAFIFKKLVSLFLFGLTRSCKSDNPANYSSARRKPNLSGIFRLQTRAGADFSCRLRVVTDA